MRFDSQFSRMNSQRFSTGYSSGDFGGSGRMVMFSSTTRLFDMPAYLIHDEDGVGILVDMAGDLGYVLRHRVGVAPRHDKSCRFTELGADCTGDIGRPCALIMRRGWPRSALGPAARDLVLLPDTGLIPKPNL
jgi:hypothetical protein